MSTKPSSMSQYRDVRARAFTLMELLVSIVVVVIIVLMGTQLMTSTTAITRTAHKHIDTDTQARVVFDRMALDFAQMLKRTDIDYYVKQRSGYNGHGNGHGWGQGKNGDKGSDQIAFFSAVPGYYPSGILQARKVRFRSSLIGSPKVHRVGLPLAMADLYEWRRGCIGLGWMTTTPQINLTRLFFPQAKWLPVPARGGINSGRLQSITTTPRTATSTQITR